MDFDLGAVMVGVLTAFAVLLVGFAVAGLWWWFAFTLAFLALLGIFVGALLHAMVGGASSATSCTTLPPGGSCAMLEA